ncbi:hypothetical protein Acr_06g0005730 [Actinidia rufa]|uniref:Reverse transcriptase zinc-binding domain-containing protein n=1 Tax=Actinidia rufa TaxID=165716 RepID=A0A7J0EQD0_9ERIC|nr:hypothetical protein Acr_06g0005730 [Actinidia rufa]
MVNLFPHNIVPHILAIHIPNSDIERSMYRARSKDGEFTVKVAYFLALFANLADLATSPSRTFPLWNRLWALKFPTKFSLFNWKLLHRILAVKVNLLRRNIDTNSSCPLVAPNIDREILLDVVSTLWAIWCNRNTALFEGIYKSPHVSIQQIWATRRRIHDTLTMNSRPISGSSTSPSKYTLQSWTFKNSNHLADLNSSSVTQIAIDVTWDESSLKGMAAWVEFPILKSVLGFLLLLAKVLLQWRQKHALMPLQMATYPLTSLQTAWR